MDIILPEGVTIRPKEVKFGVTVTNEFSHWELGWLQLLADNGGIPFEANPVANTASFVNGQDCQVLTAALAVGPHIDSETQIIPSSPEGLAALAALAQVIAE